MIEIRASAIADFLDCPARAEARHLLGKRTPSSGKALLGSALHASTAVFDRSTMEGAGITIDEAAAAAVDTIRHPNEDVDLDDDNVDQMESVAIALHGRYCREIAPKQEYAAVEVKCERLEISDLGIALTGTTDRVYKGEEGYGIADLKSGGGAVRKDGHVETKGHAFQLGIYELLAQSASGVPISEPAQIVGLQTGKTEAGQRVGIGTVYGARDALLGDGETAGVLETVAKMIQSGTFFGNPRSMLCGPKFCPIFNQCNFRK